MKIILILKVESLCNNISFINNINNKDMNNNNKDIMWVMFLIYIHHKNNLNTN